MITGIRPKDKIGIKAISQSNISIAVTLSYGNFLQVTFDFVIIAFFIFLFIKLLTRLTTKKKAEAPTPPAPPAHTKEEVLLTEIRDLLKEKQ